MKPKITLTRRRSVVVIFVFLVLLAVSAVDYFDEGFYSPSQAAQEYRLTGTVTHISDGDTFTLSTATQRQTIRVASIDAPETRGKDRPGQPFGQTSTRLLRELIANANLTLTCYEQDHYGRHVCDVPLPCMARTLCEPDQEGAQTTVSRVLVKSGLAWANMEKKGKFLRDKQLLTLQEQAQQQRLGLWQDRNPIAPWVWRYQCWRQKQCD